MSLLDIINCDQFLSFYNQNEHSSINLFETLNDKDVAKQYHEGLKKLDSLLNDDILENSLIMDDIKTVLDISYNKFQGRYKQILISIYKILNPHYLSTDLTVNDIADLNKCKMTLQNMSGNFSVKARRFFEYAALLKVFRTTWNYDTKYNREHEGFGVSAEVTPYRNSRNNQVVTGYTEKNSFFSIYGFFRPEIKNHDETFFQSNLNLFDVIPSVVEPIKSFLGIMKGKPDNESELEYEYLNQLEESMNLFQDCGVEFSFAIQRRHQMNANKATGSKFEQSSAILDIEISVDNEIQVPLELKLKNIRSWFSDFQNSRDKRNYGSRKMVELFSQGYHQAILSQCPLFFICDTDYCLCFITHFEKSSTNILSNLRTVPCDLISFDSHIEKATVPIFVLMVIIQYRHLLNVNHKHFTEYRDSIIITPENKMSIAREQYQVLNKFGELLSQVQPLGEIAASDLITTSASSNFGTYSTGRSFQHGKINEEKDTIDDSIIDMSMASGSKMDSDIDGDMDVSMNDSARITNIPSNEANVMQLNIGLLNQTEIEGKIFELLLESINLEDFAKIISSTTFHVKSINDIEPISIISGTKLDVNYSTVLESNDRSIYKVYDPLRSRIESDDETKYHSFGEKIIKVFELFVRECGTHVFLENQEFTNKPKLIEIGYLTNPNMEFRDTISISHNDNNQVDFPLSGLYIRMEKIDGIRLDSTGLNLKDLLVNTVQDLHFLNVSHGDIHIGNILYDPKQKKLFLYDFGRSYLAYYRGLNQTNNEDKAMTKLEARIQLDLNNLQNLIALCNW